jgi:hypothetical protein
MKKNTIALLIASALFVVLLGAAIFYQSSNFLYAASAVPILIVIFIPDIKSRQYIKPGRSKQVSLFKSGGADGPELLSISFELGYLNWKKKVVYFAAASAFDAPTEANAESVASSDIAASLSVLKYDLISSRHRNKWIGIKLDNLRQRSTSLNFSVDAVNRLVIHMDDIREYMDVNLVPSASIDKNIGA